MRVHRPCHERKEHIVKEGKELRMDQVLCSDASSGQGVREQKAGVTGKSYSLEREVSSMKVACEWKTKRGQQERKRKGAHEV
jgi:hypothetical protein